MTRVKEIRHDGITLFGIDLNYTIQTRFVVNDAGSFVLDADKLTSDGWGVLIIPFGGRLELSAE